MRSALVITVILLVAAFAVAQEPMSPSAPAGQSQAQAPGQPGSVPSQASPAAPSAAPSMGSDMIEGCLGGSNPNYTVTDKAGTTYQLDIPKGADASVLAKHIGESVQVQGSLGDSSAAGSAASSSSTAPSSAAGSKSIHVSRIGKGSSSCPASGSSTTPKPPSK